MLRKKVVHPVVDATSCKDCHKAAPKAGKCRSTESSGWALTKQQPDLCYDCHERKDKFKEVHTAVRQGECLECHDAHSSDLPALTRKPRNQLCLSCHEVEPLVGNRAVRHAPVSEGLCLDCHDPHGSNLPKVTRASGAKLCLRCHAADAPAGKGTPGAAFRVDLKKKTVHPPVEAGDCQDCHDGGHGSENLKMLRKPPVELCYGCHDRKDGTRYVHSAVRVGDCAVCHDPHSSDQPKLLSRASQKDLCFLCHQDDLTGRAVLHRPVAEGKCLDCHGPHGAASRFVLTRGEGKQTCHSCHKPVDNVKVRHAALDRYGCTGCHDPHGTGQKFLLPKPVNALCQSCHPQQADGKHAAAGAQGGHVIGGLLDPRRPGHEFSCASCHNPHGSDHMKLFYYGDSVMDSCAGCHGDKSGRNPELKNVTQRAFPPAPVGAGGAGGGGDGAPPASAAPPAGR